MNVLLSTFSVALLTVAPAQSAGSGGSNVRVRNASHVNLNVPGGGGGGIAGQAVVYDNWAFSFQEGVPAGSGYFVTSSTPRWHVGDYCRFSPGVGGGGGFTAARMVVSIGNISGADQSADTQVWLYDHFDANPGAGQPVYSGLLGHLVVPTGGMVVPNNMVVMFSADLTGLPGGGIHFPDDDFYYRVRYVQPGTNTPHQNVAPAFTQGTDLDGNGVPDGPNCGSSSDFYYRDANANNVLEGTAPNDELRRFEGLPNGANLVFALVSGDVCLPCDTNCDGSVNAFDIQPFVNAVGGASGCSPCSADANQDGSVNAFDIQPFVECLRR